jgi:hypothetical protein
VVRFDPAANTAELLYRDGASLPNQSPTGVWELPIALVQGSALAYDLRTILLPDGTMLVKDGTRGYLPLPAPSTKVTSNDTSYDYVAYSTGWERPRGQPWGVLNTMLYSATDMSIPASETPLHGGGVNPVITRPGGRYTRFGINTQVNVSTGTQIFWRVYWAGVQKYLWMTFHVAQSGVALISPALVLPANVAVSVGWTAQLTSGGPATILSNTFQGTHTFVEDCGPA